MSTNAIRSSEIAEKRSNKRVWYADILRITATLMVVLIHIASKDFHRVPVDSFHWQLMNAINALSRISVPIFFMVSGIFFLSPKKEVTIQSIFTKNVWRLARAFIFWSAIYILYRNVPEQPDLTTEVVEQTWWEFIQGNFHLWFLYRLAEVYIIVPILRPLTKSKRTMLYFLAVSVIVGFLTPTYRQFPIRSTDTLADNGINFDITLGYAGYMMLGSFLHRYDLPRKWKRVLYGLGIAGATTTVLGTSILSLQEGQLFGLYYEYLTPNVLFASAAAFQFCKDRFGGREWSVSTQKLFTHLSSVSFGIYLSHVLVRDILWRLGWNTTVLNPLISIPISAIAVTGLSYVLARLLLQNKWTRKIIT